MSAGNNSVINPALDLFSFSGKDVRSFIDDDGSPWFVAKDVFDVLGIQWGGKSKSLVKVPEDMLLVGKLPTSNGIKDTYFLSEPGVYIIALRSNKPEAIKFTRWVCTEVLPEIRRTGSFGKPSYTQSIGLRNQLYKTMDKLNKCTNEKDRMIFSTSLNHLCKQLDIPVPAASEASV